MRLSTMLRSMLCLGVREPGPLPGHPWKGRLAAALRGIGIVGGLLRAMRRRCRRPVWSARLGWVGYRGFLVLGRRPDGLRPVPELRRRHQAERSGQPARRRSTGRR